MSEHKGISRSRIYRNAVEKVISQVGLTNIATMDEEEFTEARDAKHLASDTRGELKFLDRFLEQNKVTRALSIGRIEHGERIRKLLSANEVAANHVSTEGILAYFHPDAVERFVQRFGEIIESEHNFSEAEKKKLLVMLIDRKGAFIEFMATVAGPLKNRLYKAIGQEQL